MNKQDFRIAIDYLRSGKLRADFEYEFWLLYSERIFGIEFGTDKWDWCFSGLWHKTDNTPEGAADRIEWVLENGLPDNWLEQMCGKDPLCYKRDTTKHQE